MKGEILRRMSMEINEDGVERVNSIKKAQERDEVDEDDYLVKTIGSFGLWQAVVSITVILTRVIALWNIMSISFLTPVVEFVCIEFSDNDTLEVMNNSCYNNCVKYEYSSRIGRSIIEEFELICQNAWLANLIQPIFILGLIVGVFVFGWISDRFGRRSAMLKSTIINGVFMIALPFSLNYTTFISIKFIIGIATGGSLLIGVVQVMEIIGKRHREIAGACCLIPDCLAEASLGGFAYFTCNWQGYMLSYGVATWFIFILIFFVPESPRWLVSHGKVDEAIKVITRAAKRNKLDTSHIQAEIAKTVEDLKLKNSEVVKSSYLDFFKSERSFKMTLIIFIIWFALGMCYYNIYQYVTVIGVDPYLSVVILGLIQVPFCPISIILNWRFGRKISTIGISVAVAVVMLIIYLIPKGHWTGSMLGVLALICSNISFSVAYIYTSELYPTPLRNMSLAISLGGASIGAMIAPFVVKLSPRWVPSLIFCVVSIVAGLCCFTLPETKGQNLKDTIKE